MTSTTLIALDIVAQMSGTDRRDFTRAGWTDGVSAMLQGEWADADLEAVLDEIESDLAVFRAFVDAARA